MGYLTDHAKLMVSLLQDMQANDQRSTMLQLVDKMKIKQKELGWFFTLLVLYLIFSWLDCLLIFGPDQSSALVLSYHLKWLNNKDGGVTWGSKVNQIVA